MRTVPFKTFLVPVPFPLVTTFEKAVQKMAVAKLRLHYVYVACATIMAHVLPYIYIYTYRIKSSLYTPDSVSLASHARQIFHPR